MKDFPVQIGKENIVDLAADWGLATGPGTYLDLSADRSGSSPSSRTAPFLSAKASVIRKR
jgi:hypothetical protein